MKIPDNDPQTRSLTFRRNQVARIKKSLKAYTASLIIRGPAVKDRFIVTDRVTGEAWWQYGAAKESSDDADRKRMTPDQAA